MKPLRKPIWRVIKRPKIKLPYDSGRPFLDVYSKESKHTTKISAHPLFTITKIQHQPGCPSIDGWINKMCVYLMEFYSATEKMKFFHF